MITVAADKEEVVTPVFNIASHAAQPWGTMDGAAPKEASPLASSSSSSSGLVILLILLLDLGGRR